MKKCLIVDDDNTSRKVAAAIVEGVGFTVIEAENAAMAYPLIMDVDVILLDWHMPDINGPELLELIREKREKGKLLVFLYSGVEDKEAISEAMEYGADDFIGKPVTKDDIEKTFADSGLL